MHLGTLLLSVLQPALRYTELRAMRGVRTHLRKSGVRFWRLLQLGLNLQIRLGLTPAMPLITGLCLDHGAAGSNHCGS
jgi:hypothetical protein